MFNKIVTKILRRTGYVLESREEALKFGIDMRGVIPGPEPVMIYNYIGEHNTKPEKIYETFYEYCSLSNIIPTISKSNTNIVRTELSIKLSQFGYNEPFISIIAKFMEDKNSTLWIDAEDYSKADYQLDMVKRLHEMGYSSVGLTIQLRHPLAISQAIECFKNDIKVRLCKGAYDSIRKNEDVLLIEKAETIVALDKKDGLLELATIRNPDLIMLAIKNKLPLQTLYGWHKKFLNHPYKLKIYVPFGTDWGPYIKRRVREII